MTKKKRHLDPNWISAQRWEIDYVAAKFGVHRNIVIDAKKKVGKSRRKVYAEIRSNPKCKKC